MPTHSHAVIYVRRSTVSYNTLSTTVSFAVLFLLFFFRNLRCRNAELRSAQGGIFSKHGGFFLNRQTITLGSVTGIKLAVIFVVDRYGCRSGFRESDEVASALGESWLRESGFGLASCYGSGHGTAHEQSDTKFRTSHR